jgi:uncharacterized cysteine cluster protein YcgN (CxxCxxCC family)
MFKYSKENWESICRRCGICCYKKTRALAGLKIDFKNPCRFLDVKTKQCTVYDRRFDVCPTCKKVNIFKALFSPYLPESCAYVQKFRKMRK